MKFKCLREDILSAIQKAEKAVAVNSTLPVMEGLLLETIGNTVCITGNDLEIAIEASFDADITESGKIVLSSRMFGDIIRRAGGEYIIFESDDKFITTITSGQSVFQISGLNAEEYPSSFDVDVDKKIVMECAKLKAMVRQTLFAVAKSETKPILTGELFSVQDGILNIVALDGFRLAIRREPVIEAIAISDFVVPFKTLNELLKVLGENGEIEIYPADRFVSFEFDNCRLTSRRLEGEYINYQKFIQTQNPVKCKGSVRQLKDTFERVSPIISGQKVKSPVKINISDDNIVIDCETLVGKVHDETAIEKLYGENLEIGFTNQFLLDVFGSCDTEEVFVEFSTPLSPMVVTPLEGDKFFYIILPIRLKKWLKSAEI